MNLLEKLCSIHAPSGSEYAIKEFLLSYIEENKASWKAQPGIIKDGIQDNLMLVFGKPTTAVYAHTDSIGYMVSDQNELSKIGSPDQASNWLLVSKDNPREAVGSVDHSGEGLQLISNKKIAKGTCLTFQPNFKETETFIRSPYMDNRLGVYNALKLCETLTNGAIVFSTYEEVGGGSVGYLAEWLYKEYQITQSLISDITWVTPSVAHGQGVAISLKDGYMPRRIFTDKIVELAKSSGIPFQIEVEHSGGSDGTSIQNSAIPVDWCFIGAAESFVHSPLETVYKSDIQSMLDMYKYLMENM